MHMACTRSLRMRTYIPVYLGARARRKKLLSLFTAELCSAGRVKTGVGREMGVSGPEIVCHMVGSCELRGLLTRNISGNTATCRSITSKIYIIYHTIYISSVLDVRVGTEARLALSSTRTYTSPIGAHPSTS